MAKLTFKRNRLTTALGFVAAAMFASAAPVQAQSASSAGTQQSDQGASAAMGAPSSSTQQNSAQQNSSMQSSGDSGTSGAASSSGGMGSSGASATTGMSGSGSASSASPASPASRDMSGGSAVSGTSSTGAMPGASSSGADTGASSAQGGTMNFSQGKLSAADTALVKQLARDNMAELQLAQLAQNKSTNDQVRSFAQQMIDDHTKAANELQQLAQAKGVTLPQSLDKKHRAEEQRLSKLSGDQFDRQYLAHAGTQAHTKVHSLLQKISRSAKDQDLRQLATNLEPDINKHLQLAQQARRSLSSETSTGGSATKGSASSGGGSMGSGSSSADHNSATQGGSSSQGGGSTSGGASMNGVGSSNSSGSANENNSR